MKKISLVFTCVALLTACAQTSQRGVWDDSTQEMNSVAVTCSNATETQTNPQTARANCTFDGWEKILSKNGFSDTDLLANYRQRILKIASAWDAGNLTKEKAGQYFHDATNNFMAQIGQRDAARKQEQARKIVLMAGAMQQMPTYKPTMMDPTCYACQQGIQQGQSSANYWSAQQPAAASGSDLASRYYQPPPPPSGVGEGARGWDGRQYIPAGSDPNPPSNALGNQTLGGN